MMENLKNNQIMSREDLQALIKQNSELDAQLVEKKNTVKLWKMRELAIHDVNWQLSIDLTNIRQENQSLTELINQNNIELFNGFQQLYQDSHCNSKDIQNNWIHCDDLLKKCRQKFVNAYTEYRSENLQKTTNQYQAEICATTKVQNLIERDIEDAKNTMGLIELGTNRQAKIYQSFVEAEEILAAQIVSLFLPILTLEKKIKDLNRQLKQKMKLYSTLSNSKRK